MKYPFKTKPYKHQVGALRRALSGPGHIGILWEPGTGKSKFVVDWTNALWMKGEVQRVLIVCPLSVVGVWEDEYATHSPNPYHLTILDKRDLKVRRTRTRLQVLVVNYDLAWRRKEVLQAYDPHVVVADESHRIKKPSARRSKYLRSLNKVPFRAILTGTPTPKNYVDIYGQWAFLNIRRFGGRVDDFKAEYVRYGGYMGRVVRGYRNVHKLKKKIDKDAIIVRKDDVLDLPERTYTRIPVELEPDAWESYSRMAYELFLELKNGDVSDAKNVAVKILRLQQITGGWIKSDEGNIHQVSTAKLNATRDTLEDLLDADQRVVCFARFRPEVEALTKLGTRFKVPTYRLDGTVGRHERDQARRAFQAKAGPSLFVAQIQAGGLGITLHRSHEVLFYSVTYALDDYIQACDRVHRIGQTEKVTYRHFVARRTIDLDIYAALREKQDIMNLIMGSPQARRKLMKSLARSLDSKPH